MVVRGSDTERGGERLIIITEVVAITSLVSQPVARASASTQRIVAAH